MKIKLIETLKIMTAILVLLMTILVSSSCYAQENKKKSDFQEIISLFPEEKIPLKYKNGVIRKYIKDINKEAAIKYFHYSEEELKMNNFLYNADDEIITDRWEDVLPGALGKITRGKYIILVYSILKLPDIGAETYQAKLSTFTYEGCIIDSITVRSQYTPEFDYCDFVFLENNAIRMFVYKPNLENYKAEELKKGLYYPIDLEGYMTIVEIKDYLIDGNGGINLVKTYPKQYVKKTVSFYRDYHKESDDPMDAYDF
jgi:hypothetical protein